jgi:integrase/recombinase XerD
MIVSQSKQSSRKSKQTLQSTAPQAKKQVSPLRQRMICDMELAGYTQGTQQSYIGAVVKLQDHYHVRPDKLTEKQVQQYIFWLRDQKKVAKGTFQSNWAGIKFFYYHTLGVDWPLFTRKKVRQPLRKRLPVPIAWEDGHRLIATLKRPDYQLCCSLMLALGLRIGDVVALTVHSIDATQMLVRVIGKRNKERVLPLPQMPRSADYGVVEIPIRRGSTVPVFPYHRYGPRRVAQPLSTPSKDVLWSAHEDGRRERA